MITVLSIYYIPYNKVTVFFNKKIIKSQNPPIHLEHSEEPISFIDGSFVYGGKKD